MKHKVSELEGVLLDAAVALAKGMEPTRFAPAWKGWDLEWENHPVAERNNPKGGTLRPYARYRVPLHVAYEEVVVDHYSTEDAHAGPIIDREQISTVCGVNGGGTWDAWVGPVSIGDLDDVPHGTGPTRRIAALRAFVARKLGPEVELPELPSTSKG